MSTSSPIRVLIAKVGLDGHERGARVVARALRDAGMEVVYSGVRQTPENVVWAATQEDVDVIGLSILSGAHLPLCRAVSKLIDEHALQDVLLVVGGTIPSEDVEALEQLGFKGIFGPGSKLSEITAFIAHHVRA